LNIVTPGQTTQTNTPTITSENEPSMNIWNHRRLVALSLLDLLVIVAVLFANRIRRLVGTLEGVLYSIVKANEAAARMISFVSRGYQVIRYQ
jgi:hypothetical protein